MKLNTLIDIKPVLLLVTFSFLLSSCTSSLNQASEENYLIDGFSVDELLYLRKIANSSPNNIELRVYYAKKEKQALENFRALAEEAVNNGELIIALDWYSQGLRIKPLDYYLNDGANRVKSYISAFSQYEEAKELAASGSYKKSEKLLRDIIASHSTHDLAVELLKDVIKKKPKKVIPQSDAISLHFDKIDFYSAVNFLGESYGINMVFDQSVRDVSISLELSEVSFYTALSLLLKTTKNRSSVIDEHTLIIYADSSDRINQFRPLVIKTFQLKSISATDMAALIKSVLGANTIGNITVNEISNTLIVNDTREIVSLIEQLVQDNDIPKGEVVLDVEIMEINLSLSEDKGIDYGAYQVSAITSPVPISGSISDAIRENTTLAIPSISIKAFKQDVEAKTLANPSIRVMHNEKAKIHIGDRVPLRTSDILDATGQTRTTFEYQEIGIRLSVEPTIHANDYVTIQMALEVSSLGENLGTQEQQAFKIGTRNAETVMYVKNGETAILGGLIRGEERSSETSVPFLGETDYIGRLFRREGESRGKSDVLLTITPRIIRPNNVNAGFVEAVDAGTGSELSLSPNSELHQLKLKPLNIELGFPDDEEKSSVIYELSDIPTELGAVETNTEDIARESAMASNGSSTPTVQRSSSPQLTFSEGSYMADIGEVVKVDLGIPNDLDLMSAEFEVMFNPEIIQYLSSGPKSSNGVDFDIQNRVGENILRVVVEIDGQSDSIARNIQLQFRTKRSGTSFLVIRKPTGKTQEGREVQLSSGNSRIRVL